jgi:3-methylcrotonyl-CoA carboxylase beta subunit
VPSITSKIDRSSEDFEKNTAAHTKLVDELNDVNDYVMKGGSAREREKHLSRGKLLVRDRIKSFMLRGVFTRMMCHAPAS